MRGVRKLALALALTALLAATFSACGGGDSNGSSTASTATAAPESDGGAGGKPVESNGGGKPAKPAGVGGEKRESGGTSSDEGSASFRVPGGDNSIQDFGQEADSSERQAAAAALTAFLEAREKGNWQGQCDNLAKAAIAPLEELAKRSPQVKGKGCAATLGMLTGDAPASTRANPLTAAGVASLRVEGGRGFALFHGTGGSDYFVPMVKEGGEWKVGAIGPSEFP
jgi:hypothetical protein